MNLKKLKFWKKRHIELVSVSIQFNDYNGEYKYQNHCGTNIDHLTRLFNEEIKRLENSVNKCAMKISSPVYFNDGKHISVSANVKFMYL